MPEYPTKITQEILEKSAHVTDEQIANDIEGTKQDIILD